jgi:CS domain
LLFANIGTDALPSQQTEETVNCRIDHYQTPSTVYVTVFAKQTDKERSGVKIEENEVTDRTAIRHSSNIKLTCADSPRSLSAWAKAVHSFRATLRTGRPNCVILHGLRHQGKNFSIIR